MSIASQIRAAVAFTGIPCQQVSYGGAEETYFTFNQQTVPDAFADDEPDAEVWLCQLHLFAPFTLDTTQLRRQVKTALREAGFTAPSMVDASENTRAADGTEQHIVFEFEISTGVGDEDV